MFHCLLCAGPTSLVLDLGETPLANELRTKDEPQEIFPLRLVQCINCQHLQIDHPVKEDRLYREYAFTSTTSEGNRRYFQRYAQELTERFQPDFVVDIGSNDGLFLQCFPQLTAVLGVDPARNIKKNVRTLVGFFDERMAQKILTEDLGKADLITCNNVFAHNADLRPILKGVKMLLQEPHGVFVFEVAYALPMLASGAFDLIYHEHVHHWHLRAASKFLHQHGLRIFDAEETPAHGGSIRVFASHISRRGAPSRRLVTMMERERNVLSGYVEDFARVVAGEREIALNIFFKSLGEYALLGYPAKACTLASFWDLHPSHVYDDNGYKIGKLSHMGQTIQPTSDIAHDAPECLLVTSWNYAGELIGRMRKTGYKGVYVIPHPMRALC